MPVYTYRHLDPAGEPTGETSEVWQEFTDTPLTIIDGCPVRRALGNPRFGWKGFAPGMEDFWNSGDPKDLPRKGK